MARPKRTKETRRLNLEMSREARERLERLRDATDADSLSEVVRKSLALYERLWQEWEAGGQLVIRHDSDDRERLLMVL